jgi:hypothetical protein
MTKQEYIDLSDLQLIRAARQILGMVAAPHDPIKRRLNSVVALLRLVEDDLRAKVNVSDRRISPYGFVGNERRK